MIQQSESYFFELFSSFLLHVHVVYEFHSPTEIAIYRAMLKISDAHEYTCILEKGVNTCIYTVQNKKSSLSVFVPRL